MQVARIPFWTAARATRHAAMDAVIDAYVVWREACGHVQIAYERWTGREPCDRSFAFAAYLAALEHEEDTARLYERRIEHVRRAALQGCAQTNYREERLWLCPHGTLNRPRPVP
jgi:hypothetical protein